MNAVKEIGKTIGALILELENTVSVDQRWVAISKTELQKGFMSLVRSIAQPTTF